MPGELKLSMGARLRNCGARVQPRFFAWRHTVCDAVVLAWATHVHHDPGRQRSPSSCHQEVLVVAVALPRHTSTLARENLLYFRFFFHLLEAKCRALLVSTVCGPLDYNVSNPEEAERTCTTGYSFV